MENFDGKQTKLDEKLLQPDFSLRRKKLIPFDLSLKLNGRTNSRKRARMMQW